MKTNRFSIWAIFGLVFLFVANSLFAQEGFKVSISEKVLIGADAKYGPTASRRILSWTKLIANSKNKPINEKLEAVNDFFNRIPSKSDMELWGKRNYWPTPVEMLARNGGSPASLAIGKYFTLLALGVRIDQLQITYVTAINLPPANQSHMVLTYYPTPNSMPLVLDNIDGEVKSASERSDLIPIYSFNGDGLWLAKERSDGHSEVSSHVELWNQMNTRMGKEFSLDES